MRGLCLFSILALSTAHGTGRNIHSSDVPVENIALHDCLKLISQAVVGPGGGSNLRTLYQPITFQGLNEKAALIVHQSYLLPTLIDHAIEFGNLSAHQKEVLFRIRTHQYFEDRVRSIKFKSSKQNPELFEKAGAHRIAVTGDDVGSGIIFDIEQIESLSIRDTFALLVHEFGHHVGLKDDASRFLDSLGTAVANAVPIHEKNLASIGAPEISIHSMDFEMAQTLGAGPIMQMNDFMWGSQVILHDGVRYHELRELVKEKFTQGDQIVDLRIEANKWSLENEDTDTPTLFLHASVKKGLPRARNFDVEFRFPLKRENSKLRFADLKDFDVQVKMPEAQEYKSFLKWVQNDLGFNHADEYIFPEGVKIVKDGEVTKLVGRFESDPGLEKGQFNWPTIWYKDIELDSQTVRVRLPTIQPSINKLEEVSPGHYEFELHLDDPSAPFYGDSSVRYPNAKLAAFIIPFRPDQFRRVMLFPDKFPHINPDKKSVQSIQATPVESSIKVDVSNVLGVSEMKLKVSEDIGEVVDFRPLFRDPSDPTKFLEDVSMKPVFGGMSTPALRKDQAVNFRDQRHEFTRNEDGSLDLVLRFKTSPYVGNSFYSGDVGSKILVSDFVLTGADHSVRVIRLDKPVEVTFYNGAQKE